jgi:hypothetical protein
MKTLLVTILLRLSSLFVQAQRPGGGPEVMLAREKQNVLENVENLTEDQKMLVSGIYDEYAVSLKEKFEEARESGSREGMREKMQLLKAEKDALIKDVLNEAQFMTYQRLTEGRRGKKEDQNEAQ